MNRDIEDYLSTQALAMNAENVAVANALVQAVMNHGMTHIEKDILLHDRLPENIINQINKLKQIFMALDSMYSRHAVHTAVIYGRSEPAKLVRLAQLGEPVESELCVNDDNAWQYLAARTANSGWANIAEDVAKWLKIGELRGEHNRRAACQTSLPICGEDGMVYGVVHLEHAFRLPENELADWVGLTLGVLPVLRELCPQISENDEKI